MGDPGTTTTEDAEIILLARRFELREQLGEGGMGVVYRAWDRTLGKEVALKRMRDVGGSSQAQRVKTEFRARSALQHKNLVQLYELVIDGDDCFFTMELVDGTDLDSWVRHGVHAQEIEAASRSKRSSKPEPKTRAERGATPANDRDPTAATMDSPSRVDPSQVTVKANAPAPQEARRSVIPPLDLDGIGRLRAALTDLCTGLSLLHDAGIVHRDVKPSNVRVTPTGRVVLLDFGLALALDPKLKPDTVAGTPRYMAPEQVRAENTTSAADLYAVGGILYEMLAGRSAFGGSIVSNQITKASGARPPPIDLGSPDDDLAELAVALLDPEAAARPDSHTVIERLRGPGSGSKEIPASVRGPTFGLPLPSRGAFFGRHDEVATLKDALRRVSAERRPLAVLVEGPSGIGKTTLLKHFLSELETRDKNALVLASRCHPQESVPFKALDAAMDALAEHASKIGDLGPFEPALAQAAVRLFPVLRTIPVLGVFRSPISDLDDSEVRARGVDALRELLNRLAGRGPLVIWIDDVQWDDADSLALLEALLRGRGAPQLLLLLSMRSESRDSEIVRRLLPTTTQKTAMLPLTQLKLGPLEEEDSARLAAVFLGPDDDRIAGVVSQSEGNPFLACELARYLATSTSDTEVGAVDVQALVAARLRELKAPERALLDVIALSVRPITTAWAIEAAHLETEARTDVLSLRDSLLVRESVSPAGETLAPYHDKIAEATQRLLSEVQRSSVHRALAETFERHAPEEADALCIHWEGAGEKKQAAKWAYKAASKAADALAFGRAAELYEKAIAYGLDGVAKDALFERTAAAHANHGRAPESARRYLDASAELNDDIGSSRVRMLKRLAAEQYVKSGYIRLGWEVMRSVLDAAKIPQPSSPGRATVSALRRRLRFLARRIDIDAIGNRVIPEDERPRLEILWTASTSMSMVNVTLSDAFRTQHLERILDVGDASSIARALAYEVALEAHVGGPLFDWHATRLVDLARRLVERTGDPYDAAWLQLGIANQAFCAGKFRDAVTACRASERILRAQCRGVAWEITIVLTFLLTSLAMLGELNELREVAERFTADAEGRADLFGVAEGFSGECVLVWWAAGRGEEMLAHAREAMARQAGDAEHWPEKSHRRGEMTWLMGKVHVGLLSNDPWPAWHAMIALWDNMKSGLIPSLQFYRSWVRHGRARAALACLTHYDKAKSDGWTRERLIADIRAMQRTIAKDKKPFGAPWGALIEAALEHLNGNKARASDLLETAVIGFDRADMALYREAARYRLADLSSSPTRMTEAEAWLQKQGVSDARTLVNALVPGFT